MGTVVPWGGITRLPIPVERVLAAAQEANLSEIVIVGYGPDGEEYFAASEADGGKVIWHLERAKFKLMVITDE